MRLPGPTGSLRARWYYAESAAGSAEAAIEQETNTHHVPGIQPADVEELLERGSRVVVLTRGLYQALQVTPEALALLEERGVEVHVMETRAGVELYNRLAEEGEAVGGLFHSTC